MANTIAEGEIEIKDDVIVRKDDRCLNAWTNTYNANVSEYGEIVASNMATSAWRTCREALYPGE